MRSKTMKSKIITVNILIEHLNRIKAQAKNNNSDISKTIREIFNYYFQSQLEDKLRAGQIVPLKRAK